MIEELFDDGDDIASANSPGWSPRHPPNVVCGEHQGNYLNNIQDDDRVCLISENIDIRTNIV